MSMTKDQDAKFKAWVSAHGVKSECPACHITGGWTLHNEILSGFAMDPEKKELVPSGAGFFALSCNNCRHVMLFAAAPITEG